MKKSKLTTAILSFVLLFSFAASTTGCKYLENDRDRVASAAITYDSALEGLVLARQLGLIDDEDYKKIDPTVQVISGILEKAKARIDEGKDISGTTLNQLDFLLDVLLDALVKYNVPQSQLDEIHEYKFKIEQLRKVA